MSSEEYGESSENTESHDESEEAFQETQSDFLENLEKMGGESAFEDIDPFKQIVEDLAKMQDHLGAPLHILHLIEEMRDEQKNTGKYRNEDVLLSFILCLVILDQVTVLVTPMSLIKLKILSTSSSFTSSCTLETLTKRDFISFFDI